MWSSCVSGHDECWKTFWSWRVLLHRFTSSKSKKLKPILGVKPIFFCSMIIFRVMIGIGVQVYSILLLTFFFMEVNCFTFVNLLWMYSMYTIIPSFGYVNQCAVQTRFMLLALYHTLGRYWISYFFHGCMPTIVTSMFCSLTLYNDANKQSYLVSSNSLNKCSYRRYKWNFLEIPLEKRLEFFESNWAFFAGFGKSFLRG